MTDEFGALRLSHIVLKNFRCFDTLSITIDSPVALICGANGTGKTSLLEALHYACYLRSFRTHVTRDLIALSHDSFFIKLTVLLNSTSHTISVGSSGNKRLVKIDNKSAVSYKDLLAYYRVISLTEDDLMLIKGGPEDRRSFLDQFLLLENPSLVSLIKEFRMILEQRNALLQHHTPDFEAYYIWSKKLWEKTVVIQTMRKQALYELESEINKILAHYIDRELTLSLSYHAKKKSDTPLFDDFWKDHQSLLKEELYFKRTLFGIHLDDFTIALEGKKSRSFASRGQQKMIVLLIKVAQIKLLREKDKTIIFLLDDFMTDFDVHKGSLLLSVLFDLQCQLIFTSPHKNSPLEESFARLHKPLCKISI